MNESKSKETVEYELENGEKVSVDIDFEKLGRTLWNLEVTRECLGHKTLVSTLRYTHGPKDKIWPEKDFIEHIINREYGKRKFG